MEHDGESESRDYVDMWLTGILGIENRKATGDHAFMHGREDTGPIRNEGRAVLYLRSSFVSHTRVISPFREIAYKANQRPASEETLQLDMPSHKVEQNISGAIDASDDRKIAALRVKLYKYATELTNCEMEA